MHLVVQLQIECHNMHIEVMDKTARGTGAIVSTRSVKHAIMNIKTLHAQVIVFTLKKIGSNKNGEISAVIIKHGVESLPDEASVS